MVFILFCFHFTFFQNVFINRRKNHHIIICIKVDFFKVSRVHYFVRDVISIEEKAGPSGIHIMPECLHQRDAGYSKLISIIGWFFLKEYRVCSKFSIKFYQVILF